MLSRPQPRLGLAKGGKKPPQPKDDKPSSKSKLEARVALLEIGAEVSALRSP